MKDFAADKMQRSCVDTAQCTASSAAQLNAVTATGTLTVCSDIEITSSVGKSALKCHVCTGAATANDACVKGTGTSVSGGWDKTAAAACTACYVSDE